MAADPRASLNTKADLTSKADFTSKTDPTGKADPISKVDPANVGRAFRPAAGLLAGFLRPAQKNRQSRTGQATIEYAILYAGVILPLTLGVVFLSELLWVWHSVVDFTREGARYAATHCWTANGDNVTTYMRTHVPRMIDMNQFQQGQAQITVRYFQRDPDTGSLVDFSCATGECSVDCIPDAVTVSVSSYQFRRFGNLLALPPIDIPDFRTSLPIQSAGCDPEQATCLP